MTIINNLNDLNRLVATSAFCPEPPLTERRAIHESGAWRWVVDYNASPIGYESHWEPAPFATDPAASYLLEQRMQQLGFRWHMVDLVDTFAVGIVERSGRFSAGHSETGHTRLIAMSLPALRALGVEFEIQEGWDKQ